MTVPHLIGSGCWLNNDVNRHRMLVLKTAMMTADRLTIELPQTEVIRIALAETLEIIGQQNKSTLDYLQAALRTLQQKQILKIKIYFKNDVVNHISSNDIHIQGGSK